MNRGPQVDVSVMTRKPGSTRRLQFDEGLLTDLRRARGKSSTFDPGPALRVARGVVPILLGLLLLAALIIVAIMGIQRIRQAGAWKSDSEPLARVCDVVLSALRANTPEQALPVCAESDMARATLEEENARLSRETEEKPQAIPVSGAAEALPCVKMLTLLHGTMAAQGVVWEQARALAFGGVWAEVIAPDEMKDPAVAVTGNLYFGVADKTYALEFTARRCNGQYVITNFWQCVPVGATPENLEQYSKEWFRSFSNESASAEETAKIKRPKHIFVPLAEE